ncbi:uridine kinase [Aquipluma nitroreducens]|uniref:Uridine kinase n=1 Tax=Aquipluma nitroreducens TaxID=2010828 RepID=A0A5K7S6M1_9BACT|nr:nucleoside kinase [Aquipluma nitroreducens]BBE17182.1 uridine kinase [Aquipluma nitroreducens]
MNTIDIYCVNTGEKRVYPLGITLEEIKDDFKVKLDNPILGALVNNKVKELSFVFVKNKKVEFIDYTHPDGLRLYVRSLFFILVAAVKEVFPEVKLKMMHGISRGYYCELAGLDRVITDSDVFAIKSEMQQLVDRNIPFEKVGLPTEEAAEICRKQNLRYKAKLFEQQGALFTYIYFMGDQANYFFGHQVPSTGYLKVFDLVLYYDGLLLRIPNPVKFSEVQPYSTHDKLFEIFQEHKDWAEILNVPNVANLNENSMNGLSGDIIKISEALHEKKIAEIANLIFEKRDRVKIVLIAGPSASGKTTFSKRLMVQLAVNGLKPTMISLDDYFVDRELTPKDEKGEYDFEAIEAIDIEYFNNQLIQLFAGELVELPKFNFTIGQKFPSGKRLQLQEGSILIVEGIHGMNPGLIPHISPENTFKIFLSALTQISIDDQNHISTTDNRLIRRMIRDSKYRNYTAQDTIRRWPSVRAGEDKNIFPYQENADIMFNSALIYELAVLKKYAEPLLKAVTESQPEFSESNRLLKFFSYFKAIDDQEIPPTSLIREFLGGSSFTY